MLHIQLNLIVNKIIQVVPDSVGQHQHAKTLNRITAVSSLNIYVIVIVKVRRIQLVVDRVFIQDFILGGGGG